MIPMVSSLSLSDSSVVTEFLLFRKIEFQKFWNTLIPKIAFDLNIFAELFHLVIFALAQVLELLDIKIHKF